MYHARFRGSHYAIGYKWGQAVKKNGGKILDHIPFELTEERHKFAQSCLPVYQKFYPEILEEIKGIADGQECANADLLSLLLGMYTLMPNTNCSNFLVKSQHGLFLCRNSDFLTSIEKLYMNTIYRFEESASFAFSSNTTAFVEMEDGVNEHGFCGALTSVAPYKIQPGINTGMLLRMMLEKCRSVAEAIHLAENIPLSGSGTLIIGDTEEEAALLELSPDKITVKKLSVEKPFLCATNMFNTEEMKPLNRLPKDNWQAEERYETLTSYLSQHHTELDLEKAQELLAGKHGFLCQYDRKTGKDTVWSAVYDLTKKKIYRAEGNPGRKKFKEDSRFEF